MAAVLESPAAPARVNFANTGAEKNAHLKDIGLSKRYTMPDAQNFRDLFLATQPKETSGYMWVYLTDSRTGQQGRRLGTYYVQITDALRKAIGHNMIVDDPHKYIEIIVLDDDAARVVVKYNKIIGSMWAALIDPSTIPHISL